MRIKEATASAGDQHRFSARNGPPAGGTETNPGRCAPMGKHGGRRPAHRPGRSGGPAACPAAGPSWLVSCPAGSPGAAVVAAFHRGPAATVGPAAGRREIASKLRGSSRVNPAWRPSAGRNRRHASQHQWRLPLADAHVGGVQLPARRGLSSGCVPQDLRERTVGESEAEDSSAPCKVLYELFAAMGAGSEAYAREVVLLASRT